MQYYRFIIRNREKKPMVNIHVKMLIGWDLFGVDFFPRFSGGLHCVCSHQGNNNKTAVCFFKPVIQTGAEMRVNF